MKNKIYHLLTKPYVVVLVMTVGALLAMFIDRNFNFFTGLVVALIILWSSKFDWSMFGLVKRITFTTVLRSLGITILLLIGFYIFEGILEVYFEKMDLSTFDNVRGNFSEYINLMIVVWIFAAFGEEFIYRGYYMKQLAKLFGNSNKAWFIAAIIISIYFGASHAYQGFTGVISVILWHLCISIIFFKNRNDLMSPILIHGFYDTVGVTLLYLNKDRFVTDWIQQLLT